MGYKTSKNYPYLLNLNHIKYCSWGRRFLIAVEGEEFDKLGYLKMTTRSCYKKAVLLINL